VVGRSSEKDSSGALDKTQLEELRQTHGKEFEKWWQERFVLNKTA